MLTEADLIKAKATDRPLTATVTKPEVFTWLDGTPMQRGPGGVTESLADGVRDEMPPLDPTLVIKGCPFFKQAFVTGGRDLNQPQWMYTTHCATWFENGKEFAHALAKGHPGYTPQSTDEMWQRKLGERAANPKLGWTSCRAIEATGFGGCAGCPHRALNKSPLNLAEGTVVAKPIQPSQGTTLTSFVPATKADIFVELPDGYNYHNGIIHAEIEAAGKKDDDAPPTKIEVPLFRCVIKNAWLEKGGNVNHLHFTFSADVKDTGGRNWRQASFNWGELGKPDRVKASLLSAGVMPNAKVKGPIFEEFFVSWLDKMQNAKEANESVPYGWYQDTEGFAFDGVLYLKDGRERASGKEPDIGDRFTTRGDDDIQDWLNAFETVRTLTCPANMIGVAASFASPLLRFSGEKGAVLSLFGRSSAGKTSASKLGMAVWGDPATCGGKSNATLTSMPDTFVALQNLPFYWDDPRSEHMTKVRETVFTATNGTGKMRSMVKSNGTVGPAPVKKFTLGNIVLTNFSIFEGVGHADRNGDAGPARVLELIVPSIKDDPNAMDKGKAADLLEKIDYHYGQLGHRWSKHIAMNVDRLNLRVKEWRDYFEDACRMPDGRASQAERFWRGQTAAVMVAAEECLQYLGVPFELDRMRDFLVREYKRNQAEVHELNLDTAGGAAIDIEGTLGEFINSNAHVTVATDIYNVGTGQSKLVAVNVLRAMPTGAGQRDNCAIHFVRADRLLRIDRGYLSRWCIARKTPPNSFIKGLMDVMQATAHKKQTLAARTTWASIQVTAIHIPVMPNSILEPMYDAYVTAAVLAEEAAAKARANDNNSTIASGDRQDQGNVA